MRVVAVMNQKGGVGKTTTTLNLSHALAMHGQRVLALDMDPQAQLTVGIGIDHINDAGMDDVILDGVEIDSVAQAARTNLMAVPAGPRLADVEHIQDGGSSRGMRLTQALESQRSKRDFVLIDCPPSAGLLGMNALFAANEVLIPVSGDYFGLHGASRMVGLFGHIEKALGRAMKRWVVVTRFHERRRLARDVRGRLLEYFPGQVLATSVRETVALAESPGFRQTIFEYEKRSRGAEDYDALALDLLEGRTC